MASWKEGGPGSRVSPRFGRTQPLSILKKTTLSPLLLPLASLPVPLGGGSSCVLWIRSPLRRRAVVGTAVSEVCGSHWASLLKGRLSNELLKRSGGAAHTESKWAMGCQMLRPAPTVVGCVAFRCFLLGRGIVDGKETEQSDAFKTIASTLQSSGFPLRFPCCSLVVGTKKQKKKSNWK